MFWYLSFPQRNTNLKFHKPFTFSSPWCFPSMPENWIKYFHYKHITAAGKVLHFRKCYFCLTNGKKFCHFVKIALWFCNLELFQLTLSFLSLQQTHMPPTSTDTIYSLLLPGKVGIRYQHPSTCRISHPFPGTEVGMSLVLSAFPSHNVGNASHRALTSCTRDIPVGTQEKETSVNHWESLFFEDLPLPFVANSTIHWPGKRPGNTSSFMTCRPEKQTPEGPNGIRFDYKTSCQLYAMKSKSPEGSIQLDDAHAAWTRIPPGFTKLAMNAWSSAISVPQSTAWISSELNCRIFQHAIFFQISSFFHLFVWESRKCFSLRYSWGGHQSP